MNDKDEISLIDYFLVMFRRKKLIVVITMASALITAIVSLLMTPIYRAETRIMPPQSSSSRLASQFWGQLGELGNLAGGMVGFQMPNAIYVDLLQSRTILDNVIDEFSLMELYNEEYREDVREELLDNLNISEEKKSGIITVVIEDPEPQRAADMANSFVQELKKLTKGLAISKAAQSRFFFEDQLADAKKTLIKAEDEMKNFQEQTGALQIEEQAKVVIEGIAALSAQVAAKEVEIRAMKTFLTENSPEVQMAEEQLKAMKIELTKLETRERKSHDPLMATGRMPEIGTEYLRKVRDLKYAETLYGLMAKQYEIARLDEVQDAVIIQVVDEAIPQEKRFKPKRTFMVAIASFVGFVIAVFVSFLMESFERSAEDPTQREKLKALRRYLSLRSGR